MKLYGLDIYGKNWGTRGCCPGHDLFSEPNRTRRVNPGRARAHRDDTKLAHRLARRIGRFRVAKEIREEMNEQ